MGKTPWEIGSRNEEAGSPWPENLELGDAKPKAGYRKSEIGKAKFPQHVNSEVQNLQSEFWNRKSEIRNQE